MERYAQYVNGQSTIAVELAITIGASGAVTSTAGEGGFTVAKNTTGVYDITLPHKFTAVRFLGGNVLRASGATLHPRQSAVYAGASTVQFSTVIAAGTATEPSSGDVIQLRVVFFYEGV